MILDFIIHDCENWQKQVAGTLKSSISKKIIEIAKGSNVNQIIYTEAIEADWSSEPFTKYQVYSKVGSHQEYHYCVGSDARATKKSIKMVESLELLQLSEFKNSKNLQKLVIEQVRDTDQTWINISEFISVIPSVEFRRLIVKTDKILAADLQKLIKGVQKLENGQKEVSITCKLLKLEDKMIDCHLEMLNRLGFRHKFFKLKS